jgi:hypothetical protein
MLMDTPGDDRFFTELRACTAELARIIDGDLDRPVPTCPGWTSLLLVLTRRRPPADTPIEIFGDQALLTHWLKHTPY